ncbi:DNA polymerase I [Natronococcus pandeyae]|uniref:DNA-directed DNA polymerase n=1 Tax=Natronococcus pandeyae TaxID=2055836 RepID=A0A8J8PXP7_9EURY|nr:type B DNA-directed DNA polymerase [Natronococcus pandeyae]TYL36380.1 DNA polymerase I [Natronococcus pandeyae]
MPYKIDYLDGEVLEWSLTKEGVTCEHITDYTPSLYISAPSHDDLVDVRGFVTRLTEVVQTELEEWRTGWRHTPETVLRIDVDDIADVTSVASDLRGWDVPGTYKCYNVDFSREFRYCLETDTDPTPARTPSTLRIDASESELARGDGIRSLTVGDDSIEGSPAAVAETVASRVATVDPDVLVLSASSIVPKLFEAAPCNCNEYRLGRRPGYQRLAGQSTYESYGNVGHSPARYNLPGRAIVDESNTFLWHEANLSGLLDMVTRSRKPLQEAAWASIGNLLTAIQICEARQQDVLTPWNSWRHEQFKSANQLHEADRGGFIFSPDVGLHEDVHELDFSSLYPNIIVTRNLSPETVRCECHAEREDVPGLGYAVCEDPGYLPDVLRPLIEDRDAIKAEIRETDAPERRHELEGKSEAIKWILVSCFGYQGFSNAKFGRIECHEAINAYAREILLDAKAILESNGWRVVHGIVDSIWVTPMEGETQTPLPNIASDISERVGIRFEYEGEFDWVAFVPLRTEESGALTKYFGARADATDGESRYKFRGIEVRQRSTPPFVAETQKELVETLDHHRTPEAVCDVLQRRLTELRRSAVDPQELVVDNRVSKRRDAYSRATRNAAALERAAADGIEKYPGESLAYVVTDDEKRSRERVTLAHETPKTYDAAFYADLLVRAAESVVSPLGWRESDIREYLSEQTDTSLVRFC